MYTINAGVCGHFLRHSDELPWSGSTSDFDQRYCDDCERSQATYQSYNNARDDYELYSDVDRSDVDRETARFAFDSHRANLANEQSYALDRDFFRRQRDGSPSRHPYDRPRRSSIYDQEYASVWGSRGRNARIDPSQEHRYESSYRSQGDYRRPHRNYSPGRYADTSGYGWENTSNPYNPASRYDTPAPRARRGGTPYPDRRSSCGSSSSSDEDDGRPTTRRPPIGFPSRSSSYSSSHSSSHGSPTQRGRASRFGSLSTSVLNSRFDPAAAEESRIRDVRAALNRYTDHYGGRRY
ncbi:hypothetical protein MMC24_006380 [Lignoscripta atroalba]|nr:hypothetical protein [Lignoscripta atroalba]